MNQFINEKDTDIRRKIDKKALLVQGITFFSDIYDQKQGMKFFKNDWFMGPFYSYDNN